MDHQGHLYMPHDNQFLKIGAGQDLQLYHDGNDSIITNGIGNLILRNTSEMLVLLVYSQNQVKTQLYVEMIIT